MPQTLTDDPDEWLDQTAPVAGEPRTAESVKDPLQRGANRVAYVKKALELIDPDRRGVRRLRTYTTANELKAETDLQDGTIAFVRGRGVYYYDSLAVMGPATDTSRIVPNGFADLDPGCWRSLEERFDIAGGYPRLSSLGLIPTNRLAAGNGLNRIAQGAIVNGLVRLSTISLGPGSVDNTNWVLYPGSTMDISDISVGDRVVVTASIPAETDKGALRAIVEHAGYPSTVSASFWFENSVSMTHTFVAGSFVGYRSLGLQICSTANGGTNCIAGGTLLVQVYRP